MPRELLVKQLVVYRLDCDQVTTCKAPDDTTVGQFLFADESLVAYSCIGNKLPQQDLLANWQVLLIQPDNGDPPKANLTPESFVSSKQRNRSLFLQGPLVAHDEMSCYLQALAAQPGIEFVPPLVTQSAWMVQDEVVHWFHQVEQFQQHTVASALLIKSHWHPVLIQGGVTKRIHSTRDGL